MKERLQKILSRYGLVSRRKAEEWIADRRVRVNGVTAELGASADDEIDVIEVDGKALDRQPKPVFLMLNKPRGFLTTLSDEKGRRTAVELISDCPERVYPIGRLDRYSEGLLLFTNCGEVANRLMHPSSEVEKEYLVWVSGYTPGAEVRLQERIEIDGCRTEPAKVHLLKQEGAVARLRITLTQGKNRQIRRLCENAELTVTRLCRVREGIIRLGDLPTGKWRYLTEEEKNFCISVR